MDTHNIYLCGEKNKTVQCSPFVTLCFGLIEMDSFISKLRYKGMILQRNYRKMTI